MGPTSPPRLPHWRKAPARFNVLSDIYHRVNLAGRPAFPPLRLDRKTPLVLRSSATTSREARCSTSASISARNRWPARAAGYRVMNGKRSSGSSSSQLNTRSKIFSVASRRSRRAEHAGFGRGHRAARLLRCSTAAGEASASGSPSGRCHERSIFARKNSSPDLPRLPITITIPMSRRTVGSSRARLRNLAPDPAHLEEFRKSLHEDPARPASA